MVRRYNIQRKLELVYKGLEITGKPDGVLEEGVTIEVTDKYIKIVIGKGKGKKYNRVSSKGDKLVLLLFKTEIELENNLYLREISPLEWMLRGHGSYFLLSNNSRYKTGDIFRFETYQANVSYKNTLVRVIKVKKMYSYEWMRWASIATNLLSKLEVFKKLPKEIGLLGYKTTIISHDGLFL